MTICPECEKEYEPIDIAFLVGFGAEAWMNEQHITGLCSDKCFDEHISGSRPEYTYDERGRRFENGVRKPFADPPR